MSRTMKIYLVRDYHMDPEVAEETGEDPVDMFFAPEEWDEFPHAALERLEMRHLYGDDAPTGDELPSVGSKILYGSCEFAEDGTIVSFERVDA